MELKTEKELLKQCIDEKFYQEKSINSDKMSEWFIKIIILFSVFRVLTALVDRDFSNVQVIVSSILFCVFVPIHYYIKRKPNLKFYISFILLWGIEPISTYYSFWLYPQYDILYGMGNTILLYYGILEMAYTFQSGVIYICLHLLTWCFAGYYSGNIPYPQDSDTYFTILSVLLFHILFFKNRFESEIEGAKNKCIIDKKQTLITTIVQAIPEGILVLDYNCSCLLKNNSFDVLVNGNLDLAYIPQLKNYTESDSTYLLEDIKVFCKSHQQKIVFGTVKASGFMLEVTGTKILWEITPAVILTFRDVTGLIKLEKEVVESASILQTLRGVSHELKTPLNAIINKVRFCINESEDNVKNELKIALSAAKFLLFSIRDIIDFSAIKFLKYTENNSKVNLAHTLLNCVKISCNYQGIHDSSIKVEVDGQLPPEIIIDKPRFKQILVSLLSKAINVSSDKKAELSIFYEHNFLKTSILFTCKEEMAKSSIIETQELYENSSKIKVDSGLLHDLTKTIIKETTKNDLEINFEPPTKFRFIFKIPIIEANSGTQDEEIPEEGKRMYPRPPLSLSKDSLAKVLVVDDIPINLQIAKSLLNGIKVECVGVLSGQEAIDYLLSKNDEKESIKLILMDCMMPEMDGWETTKMIHSLYSQKSLKYLPYIIGHSAFEQKTDIEKCFESGMDDFLPKPSPSSEYYNRISKWLAEPFRLD